MKGNQQDAFIVVQQWSLTDHSYIPKVFKSKHVVYTFVYTYFPGGVPREYSGLELAYSDALTVMYRTAKPVHV